LIAYLVTFYVSYSSINWFFVGLEYFID